MEQFLKQRSEDVYRIFKSIFSLKQGRTLSSDYRLVLQQIGLDFNISLIEDLKKQLKKEGFSSYNGQLGAAVLHCLVALFADHLLKQRLDKVKNVENDQTESMYYELSYEEMFSKYNVAGQLYFTPRQYKASVVYFYKNSAKNTVADPLLTIAGPDEMYSASIKRHAIIRTLTSRREPVEQLCAAIRHTDNTLKTEQEMAFVAIYNKTLVLMRTLAEGDSSLNMGKQEDELLLGAKG